MFSVNTPGLNSEFDLIKYLFIQDRQCLKSMNGT